MKSTAFISGKAAIAIWKNTSQGYSVLRNEQNTIYPLSEGELLSLFKSKFNSSWKTSAFSDESEIVTLLDLEVCKEDALLFFLDGLNADLSYTNRVGSFDLANSLILNREVYQFACNRLLSRLIPTDADLESAIDIAFQNNFDAVSDILLSIRQLQPRILKAVQCWERIALLHAFIPRTSEWFLAWDELCESGFVTDLVTSEPDQASSAGILGIQYAEKPELNKIFPRLPFFLSDFIAAYFANIQSTETKEGESDIDHPIEDSIQTIELRLHSFVKEYSISKKIPRPITEEKARYQIDSLILKIENHLIRGDENKVGQFFEYLIDFQLSHSRPTDLAKSLTALATIALRHKNISYLDQWITYAEILNPNDSVIPSFKAQCLKLAGRLDESLSLFDETIAQFPQDVVVKCSKAEVLREMGRLDQALKIFDNTITQFPQSVVAKCGKAEVLREMGRLDQALKIFDETIAQFPQDVVVKCGKAEVLREMGRLDEALKIFDKTIAQFPQSVVAKNGKAEVLREMGKLDEALKIFDETITQFPQDVVAKCSKAEVLREMGKLDEALKIFDNTITQFPQSVVAKCGKAEVLREMGRLDEALKIFDEAITRFPHDVVVSCGKAEVLREMGSLDEALKIFDETIAQFPQSVVAKNGKAEVLREMGRFDESLRIFSETIAQFPSSAFARNCKAEVLREMGRLDESLKIFDETISRFPQNIVARNGKAEVLREMGRLDESLKIFDETIIKFPYDTFAKCGKANVWVQQKKYSSVLTILEKYSRAPVTYNDFVSLHIYGMACLLSGDSQMAIKIFRTGLEKSAGWKKSKQYFKGSLGYALFLEKKYEDCISEFQDILQSGSRVTDEINVISAHSYFELNQSEKAKSMVKQCTESGRKITRTVATRLLERYSGKLPQNDHTRQKLDEEIKNLEVSLLLSFA